MKYRCDAIWLALDIGGANIKSAHSCGAARSRPFELWRAPERLAAELRRAAEEHPPFDAVALTMTAELCDCFASKAEGVCHVLDAVGTLVPDNRIAVWGLDGRFHSVAAIRPEPKLAMASNWLALATLAARVAGDGAAMLIDVGSTTTDIVALIDGRPNPRGLTDMERLATGELVYAGVRRTPLCALGTSVEFSGRRLGVMAEWFATTHDVYLILGDLPEAPTDTGTADGRPATRAAARRRLARMIGADAEDLDDAALADLAGAFDRMLQERIGEAIEGVASRSGTPLCSVISGSGSFLADRVLRQRAARVVTLESVWGEAASCAACAFALLQLVREVSRFCRG